MAAPQPLIVVTEVPGYAEAYGILGLILAILVIDIEMGGIVISEAGEVHKTNTSET